VTVHTSATGCQRYVCVPERHVHSRARPAAPIARWPMATRVPAGPPADLWIQVHGPRRPPSGQASIREPITCGGSCPTTSTSLWRKGPRALWSWVVAGEIDLSWAPAIADRVGALLTDGRLSPPARSPLAHDMTSGLSIWL